MVAGARYAPSLQPRSCTASGCADSLGALPHDLAIAANDIRSSTLSVLDRKEWHPAARHRGRQPGYR
jgi:hypothetical protein